MGILHIDLLRVACARLVHIRLVMTRGSTPRARIISRDAQLFQQGFALEKPYVVAAGALTTI